MIFVTVGSQMPFDRLVLAVDRWAQERRRQDVFAQICEGGARPRWIGWTERLSPDEFRARVEQADLVVAHAGMGAIITALTLGRPILALPRRGALRETRNDHQVATAQRLRQQGKIAAAFDEEELFELLDHPERIPAPPRAQPYASPQLLETLRRFIHQPTPAQEST